MIMTFRQRMEYLEEVRKKRLDMSKHPNGTYVCAELSKKSQKQLSDWASNFNIPNPANPKQYHTTIIYSRKGIPEVTDHKFSLPIKGTITKWDIFTSDSGDKCLVGHIESPELNALHKQLRSEYGATHDFDSYNPHVTLSYKYGSDTLLETVPDFKLEYTKIKIEPLDPDY